MVIKNILKTVVIGGSLVLGTYLVDKYDLLEKHIHSNYPITEYTKNDIYNKIDFIDNLISSYGLDYSNRELLYNILIKDINRDYKNNEPFILQLNNNFLKKGGIKELYKEYNSLPNEFQNDLYLYITKKKFKNMKHKMLKYLDEYFKKSKEIIENGGGH